MFANRRLLQPAQESAESPKQKYRYPNDKIKRSRNNSDDSQRLSRVVFRIILDLCQRDATQHDGRDRSQQSDTTTPAEGDTEDAANQ